MLLKMEINPAKAELITGFVETYLKLTESEEEKLMSYTKEFTQKELDFIGSLPNSWKEKGRQEEKKNIALEMIKEGFSIEQITKVTKLSIDEIKEIKKSL